MNMQIASRYSIIQSAKRFLPALYLTIAMVASSLMPFAAPIAWADRNDRMDPILSVSAWFDFYKN